MESRWLHKENRRRLIIFCNGWGMDDSPFTFLTATEYDVLILFDFTSIDAGYCLADLTAQYQEIVLIGWSMGVLAGQILFFDKRNLFLRRIAINGTLCPVDDRFGIPVENYKETLVQFNETTRLKFYRRMCRGKNVLKTFLANAPKRNLENQRDELAFFLRNKYCFDSEKSMYTDVIVSTKDFIVPTVNQCRFWGEENVVQLEGPHFPFYVWESWDEIAMVQANNSIETQV